MKDLRGFIKTKIKEFLNEQKTNTDNVKHWMKFVFDEIQFIEPTKRIGSKKKGYNEMKVFFSKTDKETNNRLKQKLTELKDVLLKNGIMLFMTTNHIDKLDPALIRPGRVDVKMEISNPEKEHIVEYLKNFYDVESVEGLDDYVDGSKPMVKIQDICLTNKYSIFDAIKEIVK